MKDFHFESSYCTCRKISWNMLIQYISLRKETAFQNSFQNSPRCNFAQLSLAMFSEFEWKFASCKNFPTRRKIFDTLKFGRQLPSPATTPLVTVADTGVSMQWVLIIDFTRNQLNSTISTRNIYSDHSLYSVMCNRNQMLSNWENFIYQQSATAVPHELNSWQQKKRNLFACYLPK